MALGKLNRLDLLAALYKTVQMPHAVYTEVIQQGLQRGEPDARRVREFWQRQQWPVVSVDSHALAALNLHGIAHHRNYSTS